MFLQAVRPAGVVTVADLHDFLHCFSAAVTAAAAQPPMFTPCWADKLSKQMKSSSSVRYDIPGHRYGEGLFGREFETIVPTAASAAVAVASASASLKLMNAKNRLSGTG